MDDFEADVDSKPNYASLILLVDVANIRPRTDAQRRSFRETYPGKTPKFPEPDGTTLDFIDECLFSVARCAPGAVIVKFADFALGNKLPRQHRDELERRFSLDANDPNKIFCVPSAKADLPLIHGSRRVGGSIISQDTFSDDDYRDLITAETQLFRHSFDERDSSFLFRSHQQESLEEWWSITNHFVNGEWLASDEYAEIESTLRYRVKEATFEWHSEPLTYRPEMPAGILDLLRPGARRKRTAVPGRRKKTDRQADAGKKRERRGVEVQIPSDVDEMEDIQFVFDHPPKQTPSRLLLADEMRWMRSHAGEYVTVVGVPVRDGERMFLEWFAGGDRIELVNVPLEEMSRQTRFVQVAGRIEVINDSILLHLDDDELFTARTFAEVEDELARERVKRRVGSDDDAQWWVPGFTGPLVALGRLRPRPGRSGITDRPDQRDDGVVQARGDETGAGAARGQKAPAEARPVPTSPVSEASRASRINSGAAERGETSRDLEGTEIPPVGPSLPIGGYDDGGNDDFAWDPPAPVRRGNPSRFVLVILAALVAALVWWGMSARGGDQSGSHSGVNVQMSPAEFRMFEAASFRR